jgi:hypothetical protein
MALHLGGDGVARGVEVAQVGITASGAPLVASRCTFGPSRRKHARHGQDLAREGVLELGLAPVVHVLGAFQPLVAEMLDGLFHRIERVGGRGQHGEFGQAVEGLGQLGGAFGLKLRRRGQFGHRPCGFASACRSCRWPAR